MTPLIVVILAVAWIVVLVPPLLRSRSDGRPSTSIGSFRQQLATLSRTGPDRRGVVRPLNRPVGVPRGPARHPGAYGPGGARPGRVDRPVRPARLLDALASGRGAPAPAQRARRPARLAATTAIGGFGLGISALVAVNLVVDAILVFYVYLLVQLRRAEEERAMRTYWSQAA